MLDFILTDLLADVPSQYWHLVVKNSKFTFLLWEFILTDELADLLPDLPSQYWCLMVKMSSNLADLPPYYWHLVVKNSKFTFLLWEFILTDQLADLPPKKTTRITIHHGIYNMGCIWQLSWILEEKVGISFLFLNNEGSKQSVSIVEWCQI